MQSLRNLPIKHKLMLIMMLTTFVALLVAGSAFVVYERAGLRISAEVLQLAREVRE